MKVELGIARFFTNHKIHSANGMGVGWLGDNYADARYQWLLHVEYDCEQKQSRGHWNPYLYNRFTREYRIVIGPSRFNSWKKGFGYERTLHNWNPFNTDDDCAYWELTPDQKDHHGFRLARYYGDLSDRIIEQDRRRQKQLEVAETIACAVILLLIIIGVLL